MTLDKLKRKYKRIQKETEPPPPPRRPTPHIGAIDNGNGKLEYMHITEDGRFLPLDDESHWKYD